MPNRFIRIKWELAALAVMNHREQFKAPDVAAAPRRAARKIWAPHGQIFVRGVKISIWIPRRVLTWSSTPGLHRWRPTHLPSEVTC
jgi:hypothetical protein